ncbi:flagellar hook-associated protein FlgL [Sphingosinicella microcystinivorans]|uniref:flagellar hook-associated protein FlgL n=1 Tax=Sphingosinicella microcystinivorans TaxID=335406 RepID=UPI0022F3918B|nr:flagellar hook-associated protein FlgL [Sphingosinicella microcystinivorans]WBX82360.1 flagellar hook-associated protein FlgL [Sphingosinicella microcystinivorans]
MRVGTFQSFQSQISRMGALQSTLAQLEAQIASGKRILDPSDDPLGSSRVADLQRSIDDNQQFIRNMDAITTQLSLADSAVDAMSNQMVRAKELAIQAANATLTDADRQVISTELGQIIDQMLSLSNTRDAAGNYLFSGASVGTAPFVRDAAGAIVWQGSGEPPKVPISADVAVSTGANGLSMLSIDTSGGRQTILAALTEFKALLDDPAVDAATFASGMEKALRDTTAGVDRLADQRATFGSRLAQVGTETDRLKALETTMTTAKSNIESLDVAAAIVQLKSAMTLLDASQQSFAQIKKLSLFSYL